MAFAEVNWRPDERELRGFAMLCVAFFGGVGAWIYLRGTFLFLSFDAAFAQSVGYALWGAAGLCAALGAVFPRGIYPLYITLTLVSLPLGFVVSHVVMALIFYFLFTPVGILFRLMRRDSLERRFERERASYWVGREKVEDRRRYFRQY